MAWKEKASPGGRGTECEHGLARPITAQNQVLGTAARRYIPAWGHAVLPEEEEEGGQEGWLASAGSPRSRRLAHDMLECGLCVEKAYVDRIPQGQVWSAWWVGRCR